MIEIEDLLVRFASADQNFSVNIARLILKNGEAVFLFGPSGSGKTTILNAVAGLIGRRKLVSDNPFSLGYVMHSSTLLPWLTIEGNILVEQALRKKKIDYSQLFKLLDEFGLSDNIMNQKPWRLSFGMKQRIEIAKALAFDVGLLMMDEALSGIDENNKGNVILALDSYLRERQGIILSITHDIVDLSRLADRVIKIRDGSVQGEIRLNVERAERSGANSFDAINKLNIKELLAS